MTKTYEEDYKTKINDLKNKLFTVSGLILNQEITHNDLLQVNDLLHEFTSNSNIMIPDPNTLSRIRALQYLDQELYKGLIVHLIHQRTDNINQLRNILFSNLGDLYTKIGDLQKAEYDELNKTQECLNNICKYYTDAATFYQYALQSILKTETPEQGKVIYERLNVIQQKILFSISNGSATNIPISNIETLKENSDKYSVYLGNLRETTIRTLNTIESSRDQEEYNNDIQELFAQITTKMQNLLACLYEDAITEMQQELGQEAPCKYVIVGLGSMALNQITPYSDLEFAIIIEKYTPEIVQYFRSLSRLVHFKCINLGETIIPTSKYGIDISGLGKQGVNFDLGGKTPLGRIDNDKKYDLIGTIEHLICYVKSTNPTDKTLPHILEKICYISGNKDLADKYKETVQKFLEEDYTGGEEKYQNKGLKNHQVQALKVLTEEIQEFDYKEPLKIRTYNSDLKKLTPTFEGDDEGSLLSVKQEIYRLPDRMIYDLGMYFGIGGSSAWNTVNQLQSNGIISETGARNLKNAISFATSLRLKSYDQSGSQTGMISTYMPALEHLERQEKNKIIKALFQIKDRKDLYDFFYVMMSFIKIINAISLSDEQTLDSAASLLIGSNIFDNSDLSRGKVHAKFLEYDKAIEYFENAQTNTSDDDTLSLIILLDKLHIVYHSAGKIEKSLETATKIADLIKTIFIDEALHPEIAKHYNNLGTAYANKGLYDQAIENYQQALKLRLKVYTNNLNHPSIADTYNNLGAVYIDKSMYDEAIENHKKSLKIYKLIYSGNLNHSKIAINYNNLGTAYAGKGLYEKAIKAHLKALTIHKLVYVKNPNHPDIANAYNCLADTYVSQDLCDEAVNACNKSLDIKLKIYMHTPNHPSIGNIHSTLGVAYTKKSLYNKAIEEYTNALEIYKLAYINTPNHPYIAEIHNNLGAVYITIGLYDRAIENLQQAVEIYMIDHKIKPVHSSIADCYKNLGLAYTAKGLYNQAIKEYTSALEIYKLIYIKNLSHSDIADIHNKLGKIYTSKGLHDQAIKEFEKVLKIYKFLDTNNPNHLNIADVYSDLGDLYILNDLTNEAIKVYKQAIKTYKLTSSLDYLHIANIYNNLGSIYADKGLHNKAIKKYEQALEIHKLIHPDDTNQLDIADIYNNLGVSYATNDLTNEAIETYKQALKIYKLTYIQTPNHVDIADTYNNLGNIYIDQNLYYKAIVKYKKALEIYKLVYSSHSNHSDIVETYNNLTLSYIKKAEYSQALSFALQTDNELLVQLIYFQLGNEAYLKDNLEEARKYYIQVHSMFEQLNFNSEQFASTQSEFANVAYNYKCLLISINCQQILLKIDPELQYGNHYHNLACFSGCQGKIEEANQAFIKGLTHKNAEPAATFYTEYSQFLILNRFNKILNIKQSDISKILYNAIKANNDAKLSYGNIEKKCVVPIIKEILKQQNDTIDIDPKVLAYYLLITHPEYVKQKDNIITCFLDYLANNDDIENDVLFLKIIPDILNIQNNQQIENIIDESITEPNPMENSSIKISLSGEIEETIE